MKNPILFICFICSAAYNINAQLICKSHLGLSLSFEGTGTLRPIDLLDSPINPSYSYSISESTFNCADVGRTIEITVGEFNGVIISNICTSLVTVEDKFDNGPCDIVRAWCITDSEPVLLNSSGELTMTPEIVSGGAVSPAYDYEVTPSFFDCADIGTQSVTLTVTGANGSTATCSSEVTIASPSFPRWTCLEFLLRDILFYPDGVFANYITPGIIVPFYINIEKSLDIKKSVTNSLTLVLSKDQEISKDDQVLFSQNIQFKPKDLDKKINSKFQVPQNTQVGTYYLLADMTTANKKEIIGFKKFILPITVGFGENGYDATENRNSVQNQTAIIYPNPIDDVLYINQLSKDVPTSISMMDMTGKILMSTQVVGESTTLQTGMLPTGIYVVRISNEKQETQIFKIIKNNH